MTTGSMAIQQNPNQGWEHAMQTPKAVTASGTWIPAAKATCGCSRLTWVGCLVGQEITPSKRGIFVSFQLLEMSYLCGTRFLRTVTQWWYSAHWYHNPVPVSSSVNSRPCKTELLSSPTFQAHMYSRYRGFLPTQGKMHPFYTVFLIIMWISSPSPQRRGDGKDFILLSIKHVTSATIKLT